MKQWVAMLMCLGFFSGCSMSFNYDFWSQKAPTTPAPVVSEVKIALPNNILMYELDITDRPYASLGEVSASVTKINPWGEEPKQEAVEAKLKEEALKKGADALIYVRYTKLGASWNRLSGIEGKAQAVKFTRY
ncbi:YbjQ family protein [Sulfurospirillum oryzae]|uniref:YbjQ family protein n=1 Tax=Sulfurospirillum oryzae TaxID=2976535 RepID=UPI0021E7877A|nr:YbjQ family protein [Sulfurospirillum oryzae]